MMKLSSSHRTAFFIYIIQPARQALENNALWDFDKLFGKKQQQETLGQGCKNQGRVPEQDHQGHSGKRVRWMRSAG